MQLQPCEKIEEYVNKISEQIRWKRVRPGVAEEMRNHIVDQRDAYLAEGLDEATATEKAIADTGDADTIGTQLDRTHRPKPQWGMLGVATALVLIGLCLRVFCVSDGMEQVYFLLNPMKELLFAGLALLAMAATYFLDFTLLGKYPKIIYVAFVALFIFVCLNSPHYNGRAYYAQFVAVITPLVFAGIVYSMRGKGYGGIILCGIAFVVPGFLTLTIPMASLFVMSTICCVMLLIVAICKDWFGVKRLSGILLVILPTVATIVAALLIRPNELMMRIAAIINPYADMRGYGWTDVVKRTFLANSRLIGRGTMPERFLAETRFPLPEHTTDNFLTYIIFNLGWLAAIAIMAVVVFFIVKGFMLCLKQKSMLGLLVSLSVMSIFTTQVVGYVIWNMGVSLSSPMGLPFISYGNTFSVICAAMIGFMLSCFRTGDSVHDNKSAKAVGKKNRFITWDDGKIVITLK